MMSRSYTNLLDLASGNFSIMGKEKERKRFPRVMTVPGSITELDDDQTNSVTSENPSSVAGERMIIVGFWSFAEGQKDRGISGNFD